MGKIRPFCFPFAFGPNASLGLTRLEEVTCSQLKGMGKGIVGDGGAGQEWGGVRGGGGEGVPGEDKGAMACESDLTGQFSVESQAKKGGRGQWGSRLVYKHRHVTANTSCSSENKAQALETFV